jgi:SAM-dependent methyltransferase
MSPEASRPSPVSVAPPPRDPHWSDVAFHWDDYGPPLRPSPADVAVYEAWIDRACTGRGARMSALLLGVTPEIATLRWPAGARLTAIDRSAPMIARVWPGDVDGRRALEADWFAFDPGGERYDVIVGDGVFTILDFPGRFASLAARIRAWLAPGGTFLTRLFLRPAQAEPVDDVARDLREGRAGSIHAFKFRLAMALQRDAATGVRMREVHDAWRDLRIDADALARATGWPRREIETLHYFRGRDARLSFPTPDEMRASIAAAFDVDEARVVDGYPMAGRCPLWRLVPRAEHR